MKGSIYLRVIGLAAFFTLVICLACRIVAATGQDAKKPQYNVALYNNIMSQRLDSVEEIVAESECQQLDWLPIVPPGPGGYIAQEGGLCAFDPSKFSGEELQTLERVATRWADATATQIEAATHSEAPWSATQNGKTIDYEMAEYRQPIGFEPLDKELATSRKFANYVASLA